MSVRYLAVQVVSHQTYQVPCVPLFWKDGFFLCSCSRLQDFCSLSILLVVSEPSEKLTVPLGIFIIWILYLLSSHGLPANNFQPALQTELLGSRTVGPGTAESTHSAWTETAACSLPSSWLWSWSLLACGPPQPAEISFIFMHPVISLTCSAESGVFHTAASWMLLSFNYTAPVHQVYDPVDKTGIVKVEER